MVRKDDDENEGEEGASLFWQYFFYSLLKLNRTFNLNVSSDTIVLLMLRVTYSQTLVAGVIMGLGVLFCVLSVMQNCYHWRVEKNRADEGLPVYDR